MSSPAKIIKELLVDLDVVDGSGNDWKAYVAFLPDKPDQTVCIYDSVGKPDGRIMATGERIEHLGVQVMVRGLDYPAVYAKVKEICDALDGVIKVSVATSSEDSYTVHNVSRVGTPLAIGIEPEGERRRHSFSINAVTTITKET